MTGTAEQAWATVEEASSCGDHPIACEAFVKEDIAEVLGYWEWQGSCAEHDTLAAFVLRNGKHVVAKEGSDSSGHG